MQPRIDNPAQTVPGAMQALLKLGNATQHAGVPATTHYLLQLRASQINGCSICVDMHSRELKAAGEPTSASTPSQHGERRRTSPTPNAPRSRSPRP
jgi:AhpD family alkylhydroperoxidase